MRYWTGVYGKHENKITEVWNDEIKREYIEELMEQPVFKIGEVTNPVVIREHMDALIEIENYIHPMSQPLVDTNKVKNIIKKMKNKKSAVPDGLKVDLYKALMNSEVCMNTLVTCLKKKKK